MTDTTSADRHPELPPELLEAVDEFDAWSQDQLLSEQRESTPAEPLYHYTGEEAFRGILGNERLWCFSHLDQSDRTEFQYSLAIARRVIGEISESSDFFIRNFCRMLDDLLDDNSFENTFDFYLFSLSRHRDDPSQWRTYGRQGRGVAIGFAPSLFLPDRNELASQANENVYVGRVIYGDNPAEERHRRVIARAVEITSRVARSQLESVTRVRPGPYLRAMALEVIASQLVWNCLTAKHANYENEREVRYLLMGAKRAFDAHRKTFRDRSYIEAPLPLKVPGNIREILIGSNAPADSKETVARFLNAQGYSEDISVIRSEALL
jgi:hypothetical protein